MPAVVYNTLGRRSRPFPCHSQAFRERRGGPDHRLAHKLAPEGGDREAARGAPVKVVSGTVERWCTKQKKRVRVRM